MPFTVVSHQGLVTPLLVRGRLRLDGVALIIGTTAPDLAYAWSRGTPIEFDAHRTPPIFLFCAPVAVLGAIVFRRWVARPLAVHLPDLGPLRLRDVAHAATDRYSLAWMYACGALGAALHLLFDSFTHPEPWAVDLTDGWLLERVHPPLLAVQPANELVYAVLTTVGAVLVPLALWLTGIRRARAGVARPHLPAPTRASTVAFAGPLVAGVALGMALAAWTWSVEAKAKAITQLLIMVCAGVVAGGVLARRALRQGAGNDDRAGSHARLHS